MLIQKSSPPVIPPVFFADRSDRGRLTLTGRDRQSFLQGMVTNDVHRLAPGSGCYTFLLDSTGHILADARVLVQGEYLLLDVEPETAPFVRETLDRYLIMERVEIADVTADFGQVQVSGREAAALMEQLGWRASEYSEGSNTEVSLDGSPVVIASVSWTPFPDFMLYGLTDSLVAWLTAQGVPMADDTLLEGLRIEAGIPRFGVDMDARVLGPETGQQKRAISYKKGCYIGQEIVARIDARGRVNRGLGGFRLSTTELPDAETPVLIDGKEVGRVTSAAIGPLTGEALAMGYIRREHSEPGTIVQIQGHDAVVAELPFVATP
ncbi:MAG: glycine cleavage T C-terminal barrel domain-containing protein [Armatimonadaceae bacterium]